MWRSLIHGCSACTSGNDQQFSWNTQSLDGSLMYNIAFQPSQQTFKMTSITREARGTYEMEANIAPLTSTFEQTCSLQNCCQTSTKPRLWPLVMVGILRVLVLYGPVGISASCQHGWLEDSLFSMMLCLVGMLRDTIVPSQHTKTRRFLLPCGRPGPRFVWPWLPSAIQMATPTSGGWCGGAVIPHLADLTSVFGDFAKRNSPLCLILFFWGWRVFIVQQNDHGPQVKVKVNFRGNAESVEYWVKWIGWFYCNLPTS